MVILDATVVNVALPSIQADLDLSEPNLQWVVNAYTLVFGGFLLLGGRAGDLIGRKRLFLAGVVVFTLASLLNGLAPSSTLLIIARGLQGLGAALVSPAALSIVTTTFEEGARADEGDGRLERRSPPAAARSACCSAASSPTCSRGRGSSSSTSPSGSPRSCSRALRAGVEGRARAPGVRRRRRRHRHRRPHPARLRDRQGARRRAGCRCTRSASAGFALALLAAFLLIEHRSAEPLVRLGSSVKRTIRSANVVMLIVAAGLFAMFYFNSLYVQRVLGYSPIQAGLAFVPFTLGIVIGAGLSQALVRRSASARSR